MMLPLVLFINITILAVSYSYKLHGRARLYVTHFYPLLYCALTSNGYIIRIKIQGKNNIDL